MMQKGRFIMKLLEIFDRWFLPIGVFIYFVFIPIYPKLPLFGVEHTWTYIRLEDLLISFLTILFLIKVLRNKERLKTPLTKPILIYWLAGLLSTLVALFLLAPHLANFFPNVAIFHYLRRIEYLIPFFFVYTTVKENRNLIKFYLVAIIIGLLGVIVYGFGQKFIGLPAYLTMNEEFAKGIPLRLGPNNRITSTFGGHYDLAAYLVLMLSLFGGLFFGVKNKLAKIFYFILFIGAYELLLLTASRVSFLVYLLAISMVLVFLKQKKFIIPVILVSFFLSNSVGQMSERLGKTFRVENVVYDKVTGRPIAKLEDIEKLGKVITEEEEVAEEDLPLGTGFIALPPANLGDTPAATSVAIIKKKIITPLYETLEMATKASEIATISGSFLIQKALVYDISFTTRFQGTWPRAINAFKRNILTGSGYSSISLATDNSYLRALGETGVLGLITFLGIFLLIYFWAKEAFPSIKNSFFRSMAAGILGGTAGIAVNALMIDIFEASKVAFTIWPLIGILMGIFISFGPAKINFKKSFIQFITSPFILFIFICVVGLLLYSSSLNNYFLGDDFTWLRWGANFSLKDIYLPFIDAGGFFYRPIGKIYFFLLYSIFWLKPFGYHIVSIIIHLLTALGVFLLTREYSGRKLTAFLAALFFTIIPSQIEAVVWSSGIMIALSALFIIWALYFWSKFLQVDKSFNRIILLFLVSIFGLLALFSHESGIVFPLLCLTVFVFSKKDKKDFFFVFLFIIETGFYLFMRIIASSHWLSGDYNYNFMKLPVNFIGNLFGYFGLSILGTGFLPMYQGLRGFWRQHIFWFVVVLIVIGFLFLKIKKKINLNFVKVSRSGKTIFFFLAFSFVSLLPFLGLGNISVRYNYLASSGFGALLAIILVCFASKARKYKTRIIALTLTSLFLSIYFVKLTSRQLQQWSKASNISYTTLRALKDNYLEFPQGTTLCFVNVPIKYQNAWVFPVGLEDALWFIYRDQTLGIVKVSELESAKDYKKSTLPTYVFVFDEQSNLKEYLGDEITEVNE